MDRRPILVLAPHPDDEVVSCAAAIGRARAMGAEVRVLYLTTGVPDPEVLWPWQRAGHAERVARRRAEARRAAELLGVEVAGFAATPTRRLKEHLAAARAAVAREIVRMRAGQLWVTAYEGGHQDHDAANCLASTFRDRLDVIEFAAYNFAGGAIRSQTFVDSGEEEEILVLSAEERTFKAGLLAVYGSEAGNLGYVDTARECRRPIAAHDYTRPPHAGRLFRERYSWVPFDHPRVDGDPQAEVNAALSRFLEDRKR